MNEYDNWFSREGEERYIRLRKEVQRRLGRERQETDSMVRRQIYEVLAQEASQAYLPVRERVLIGSRIFYALRGLDILQPLLEDEAITEIMVNGPDHIYVEYRGKMIRTKGHFESLQRLEDVIQQIVGSINRRVNEANPIVDARLADGSRVNVILPPVALNGPILTIRKFRKEPIRVKDMIHWGTFTEEAADFLRYLVENRYNIFVCGGTGAGKTTLLNVLSNFIPEEERVITIEDAAELRLSSLENVITLETRNGALDGRGRITMRDLIRTSLRARPDRIIVGEVRGAEALDMLSAMNTGHEGSLSTGHANSTQDMISRLETMVLMGADLPMEAIRQQIASAIDIFVYIARGRGGQRMVTEISQVLGMTDGQVKMESLFSWREGKLLRTEAKLHRRKERGG
ncbi:MAG TPA: CpaF family protein [Candidatus Faecimorpha stercoravium]|nr:CpaF family protein [Candidatus Faecimorpha stercoravium]